MKFMSIRTKLASLILIVLVPLVILQMISIEKDFKHRTDMQLESNLNFAQTASKALLNYIDEIWIQQSIISSFFTSHYEPSISSIQSYLETVQSKQSTTKRIMWVSPEGKVLASSRPEFIGISLIQRKYFKDIINGEEKVISNLEKSYVTDEPVLPIALAVKKNNKLLGVIVSIVDINKFLSRLPNSNLKPGDIYGFVDANGRIIFKSGSGDLPFEERLLSKDSSIRLALKGELMEHSKIFYENDGVERMGVDYPIKEIGWAFFVGSKREFVLASSYHQAIASIILLFLVTSSSLFAAIYIGSKMMGGLRRLNESTRKIMNGDYSTRVEVSGNDEITDVSNAFNNMAESIEQYDKLKSQFFSNLSHEFRTPLHVIFSSVQLILSYGEDLSYKEYRTKANKNMKTIKQNCYRLMRLIGNLIDITRYDNGFLKLQLGNHNIVQVVEDITLSIVSHAEAKGINVIFDTEYEERIIACDPDAIERIVLNIVSNALKFTEKNGTIFIKIYSEKGNTYISIEDTGIGIREDKLGVIFERFRQLDNSLSRKNEGSGIGLSIVKSLVEAHNGTISVKSQVGKGTEFIIELPERILPQHELAELEAACSSAQDTVERINIEFSDIYY